MTGIERKAVALMAVAAMVALPLCADAGPIESRLEARRVVIAEGGRESYAPAESARPGDVIEYVATYRNVGERPVRRLQATLPIPAHTELLPDSVRPANVRASVDAVAFETPPLMRQALRDGRPVAEPVPFPEYRYLRWSVGELAPRQSASFSARVRVVNDAGS